MAGMVCARVVSYAIAARGVVQWLGNGGRGEMCADYLDYVGKTVSFRCGVRCVLMKSEYLALIFGADVYSKGAMYRQ